MALSVTDGNSDGELQSSTWPTSGSVWPPFGIRTSPLGPLVSAVCPHDLHGDTPASPGRCHLLPRPFSALAAAAASPPLSSNSGELAHVLHYIPVHHIVPAASPWTALPLPPLSRPCEASVSSHFAFFPKFAGTGFFSDEVNAELHRATLLFLLASLGSLGFGGAPTPHLGRSTAPTAAGHDA